MTPREKRKGKVRARKQTKARFAPLKNSVKYQKYVNCPNPEV